VTLFRLSRGEASELPLDRQQADEPRRDAPAKGRRGFVVVANLPAVFLRHPDEPIALQFDAIGLGRDGKHGVLHLDRVARDDELHVRCVEICFAVGVLARTRFGQQIGDWLDEHLLGRIPGFRLIRGMIRQFAGKKGEKSFQPALVEIEEALVPAFIVEKHADGQFTVFVSSSPTPMAGSIYILQPERVHPVDVPLHKAIVCVTKWGAGAAEMRTSIKQKT